VVEGKFEKRDERRKNRKPRGKKRNRSSIERRSPHKIIHRRAQKFAGFGEKREERQSKTKKRKRDPALSRDIENIDRQKTEENGPSKLQGPHRGRGGNEEI